MKESQEKNSKSLVINTEKKGLDLFSRYDESLLIKIEKKQKTISLEFTRLECNLVKGSEEHYQEFWVDFNTYKGLRGVA